MTDSAHTRDGDPAGGGDRLRAARREGRWRTMFYSAIVAGLVALAVVKIGEVQNFNAQVDRNRQNCQLLQDDRRDRSQELYSSTITILGDKKSGVPAANFNDPRFAAFKPFKKLLIAQAVDNRKRARLILLRIENCKQVFPKRKTVPIIG